MKRKEEAYNRIVNANEFACRVRNEAVSAPAGAVCLSVGSNGYKIECIRTRDVFRSTFGGSHGKVGIEVWTEWFSFSNPVDEKVDFSTNVWCSELSE